jgi:purine catabolism regulator
MAAPSAGSDADEVPVSAPTVREAMTFGGFRSAQLIAGRQGLDRRIAWVRVMETPETVDKLNRGDLLLTTAFPIKDDRAAQLELVAKVAEADGAGVIVKPERYIRELPAEMAEEADRHALPLFTLGLDISWVDLMAPLLERIISAEHSRLKRSMDIHRRFTELVLDGKGAVEICRTLAELVGSAVTIEDASFHLLAHAGGSPVDAHRRETIARHGTPPRVLFDPQIQRMLREVDSHRGPTKVPAFPHLGMSRERIIAPIAASNQILGYISILDHPPDNEELAFMAIEQAAIVLALALTKEREVAEVEARVRGEFLEELVQGTYGEDGSAQRRARHLGYPLSGQHVLILVDIDDFRGFHRANPISEDAIQAIKREYLRRISGVVRKSYPRALVGARSDSVVTLLPIGAENGDSSRVHALALEIKEAISDWKPGFTVSIGYSAPAEAPAGIAGAHREVRSVLEAMARFKRWGQVVGVPELGLTGLLAAVRDDRLVEFTSRHLGRLAEHDRAKGGALLETLKAYLEEGEQLAAARRLKVHPNTLRYRLERAREVSGADFDDPETRLNLAVAIRVQTLLGL